MFLLNFFFGYFGENVNNGWLNHGEQVFIMTSFLYFITFNNGYNGTFRITTVAQMCMLKFTYHQIIFPSGCNALECSDCSCEIQSNKEKKAKSRPDIVV